MVIFTLGKYENAMQYTTLYSLTSRCLSTGIMLSVLYLIFAGREIWRGKGGRGKIGGVTVTHALREVKEGN